MFDFDALDDVQFSHGKPAPSSHRAAAQLFDFDSLDEGMGCSSEKSLPAHRANEVGVSAAPQTLMKPFLAEEEGPEEETEHDDEQHMIARANAAQILSQATVEHATRIHHSWAAVPRGRDLFVPGWGGFDVEAALHACHANSLARVMLGTGESIETKTGVPSVAKLRSFGYVLKLFPEAREPMHREQLRRSLLEPAGLLARYIFRHHAAFADAQLVNRLDEVEKYFSSITGSTEKALREQPGALLKRLARERSVSGRLFVRFSHIWGVMQPLHFPPDGCRVSASDRVGEDDFVLSVLEDSHAVARAAQELNNCAADYVGEVRRRRCALFVLRQSGKTLAMGEWDLHCRRWCQISEHSDEPVREDWQLLFDELASCNPFPAQARLPLPGVRGDAFSIFNPTAACPVASLCRLADESASVVEHWLSTSKFTSEFAAAEEIATALLVYAADVPLDASLIRALLEKRADPDAMSDSGWTPLMLCVASGRRQAFEVLLEAAADPNAREASSGRTALMMVASSGLLDFVNRLLERRADSNVIARSSGKTALAEAAERCHWIVVSSLLAHGSMLDAQQFDGRTILMLAAEVGQSEVVRQLLERHANANLRADDGRSALLAALEAGHLGSAGFLALAPGANLEARVGPEGLTPLMHAARAGRHEAVSMLVESGALLETATACHETALALAARARRWDLVRHLAELRASVDVRLAPDIGGTALMLAAREDEAATVELLVAHSADVDLPDADGLTALAQASRMGHLPVLRLLLSGRADPAAAGEGGEGALAAAAAADRWPAVQLLVETRGNLEAKDLALGRTALIMAAAKGQTKAVVRLVECRAALEARDDAGSTALAAAAAERQWMAVRRLADACADLEVLVLGGGAGGGGDCCRTALLRAAEIGQWDTVLHLARRSADVRARGVAGRTALMYAAECAQEDAVWTLLRCQADVDAKDDKGDSALVLACHRQLDGMMKVLWEGGASVEDDIPRVRNPVMKRLLQEWLGLDFHDE
mmetsp:Transcript_81399/g.264232  ORF Transcript_81399/g.264232 Transcript_81399/m.264232 type:complete len:1004 (-) Transcript_81399:1238-4249(-)